MIYDSLLPKFHRHFMTNLDMNEHNILTTDPYLVNAGHCSVQCKQGFNK